MNILTTGRIQKKFAEEALTGEVMGIHGFWHENIFEAVYCTNLLMRSCDVLVTKTERTGIFIRCRSCLSSVSVDMNSGVQSIRQKSVTVRWNVVTPVIHCKCWSCFLNEETLLFQMCNCIEANKKAGIYDGAYKAVELAAAESR